MAQVEMKVKLLGHTQLSEEYVNELKGQLLEDYVNSKFQDGQVIALSAIRNCYSHNKPSEIFDLEGQRYFKNKATDGGKGTEADRLIRMIVSSGHTSTLEHISFTFAVENVSRALLAQLTRHRVGFGFSVKSQRYVRFGSNDRSGGFDYVIPDTVSDKEETSKRLNQMMYMMQSYYDELREMGIPAEDARAVLPNAAACDIVLSVNLRALLDFYSKRKPGKGAQKEISVLSEKLRDKVIEVELWTESFFGGDSE